MVISGWATDLKSASAEMIRKRIERTGDGSHDKVKVLECYQKEVIEKNVWGWGEKFLNMFQLNK